VLSWSLLEAISAGCAVETSDTVQVREAIRHGETGYMMDFFDPAVLTRQVIALCDEPTEQARLWAQARAFEVEHNDLVTPCLLRQIESLKSIQPFQKTRLLWLSLPNFNNPVRLFDERLRRFTRQNTFEMQFGRSKSARRS
jgi:hypothetical protein